MYEAKWQSMIAKTLLPYTETKPLLMVWFQEINNKGIWNFDSNKVVDKVLSFD